jgi:hypothetical protein
MNFFFRSNKVTVQTAILDGLFYPENLILSPAQIVDG